METKAMKALERMEIKAFERMETKALANSPRWERAARTQAPTATNYDVGSTTWVDLRRAPLLSAMEATNLGHGPYGSHIDPVQETTDEEEVGFMKVMVKANIAREKLGGKRKG
ncbi:hypothetical protein RHMOL_Rhmol12G0033200 [Rhododendron molle]|uniref:Uncharacterized protein n=1 Tax=Rhododendron molle TaxID=49168 RepID=A0ACC0LE93_RHOML|nr:hypothetical protein RHMOL_Rhmol12G0033200 [Rhododendron molle]